MSNVKELIKKTFIGDIRKLSLRKKAASSYFDAYEKSYNKYSATNYRDNRASFLRTRILISSHSVEKGLCHQKFRAGFAKDVVKELYSMIIEYDGFPDKDQHAIDYGTGIIRAYHNRNIESGYDVSNIVDIEQLPKGKAVFEEGIKDISIQETLDVIKGSNFEKFCESRVSVRMFDSESLDIKNDILQDAVRIAQTSPNACNRQATKVHIVKKKELFKDIEEIQLGCKGFAHNSGAFLFITSDLGLYENAEVKLPVFDAGIFTMNLVYALHSKGLFSCVLNASFPGDAENKIRTMLNIPNEEMINGLISVSRLDDRDVIKVPASVRRSLDNICTIIE